MLFISRKNAVKWPFHKLNEVGQSQLVIVNDRNGLKRDSAETEASVTFTEASAEASAESFTVKYWKKCIFPILLRKYVKALKLLCNYNMNFNQLT